MTEYVSAAPGSKLLGASDTYFLFGSTIWGVDEAASRHPPIEIKKTCRPIWLNTFF